MGSNQCVFCQADWEDEFSCNRAVFSWQLGARLVIDVLIEVLKSFMFQWL